MFVIPPLGILEFENSEKQNYLTKKKIAFTILVCSCMMMMKEMGEFSHSIKFGRYEKFYTKLSYKKCFL